MAKGKTVSTFPFKHRWEETCKAPHTWRCINCGLVKFHALADRRTGDHGLYYERISWILPGKTNVTFSDRVPMSCVPIEIGGYLCYIDGAGI